MRELSSSSARHYARPLSGGGALRAVRARARSSRGSSAVSRAASAGASEWRWRSPATRGSSSSTSRPPGSIARRGSAVWEAIRAHARGGGAVLLTTHHLEEADALADRVVLIERRRVVADGPVARGEGRGRADASSGSGPRRASPSTGAERDGALPAHPHARRRRRPSSGSSAPGMPLAELEVRPLTLEEALASREERRAGEARCSVHARAMTVELAPLPGLSRADAARCPTVFFLFFVSPGPAAGGDGADGDVRRLRGDRRRVLPVRRRNRRRPRLAVGGLPADAAGRARRPARARGSLSARVFACAAGGAARRHRRRRRPTRRSPPARWVGARASRCSPAPSLRVPRDRARLLGAGQGRAADREPALPGARPTPAGSGSGPRRLPHAVAAISPLLPTRALSDALVATALGAPVDWGAWLALAGFAALFACARGRRLPARRGAAVLVSRRTRRHVNPPPCPYTSTLLALWEDSSSCSSSSRSRRLRRLGDLVGGQGGARARHRGRHRRRQLAAVAAPVAERLARAAAPRRRRARRASARRRPRRRVARHAPAGSVVSDERSSTTRQRRRSTARRAARTPLSLVPARDRASSAAVVELFYRPFAASRSPVARRSRWSAIAISDQAPPRSACDRRCSRSPHLRSLIGASFAVWDSNARSTERRRIRGDAELAANATARAAGTIAAATKQVIAMHDVDGVNAGYARLLLDEYLDNPEAVPPEWRALFENGDSAARPRACPASPGCSSGARRQRQRRDGNGRATRRRRARRAAAARAPRRRRSRPRAPRSRPAAAPRRRAARRRRRRDGARQGAPHARPSRRPARPARLRADRRSGARPAPARAEADARAPGADPDLGPARPRRRRDARRGAAAAQGDLLRLDGLRDGAHRRPRAARLAAQGDRVVALPRRRSSPTSSAGLYARLCEVEGMERYLRRVVPRPEAVLARRASTS